MDGRTALVTGGSRGIGDAAKKALEKAGYKVLAPTRDELDVSDAGSIGEYMNGREVDALVNNAGINNPMPADEIDDATLRDTFNVNILGPIMLARAAIPGMKKRRWGRIVNVSSIFGVVSKEKRVAYSATKSAINGMTRALAVELGPYNILVNSICPGYTDTELTKKNVTDAERKALEGRIPLRRFASPEEMAKAIAFLASGENTYITGQEIIVDGGFTCC